MAWVGAVIYKIEKGELFFLVQDSQSLDEKYAGNGIQTKFPGGSNDDHSDEKETLVTLRRELEEETWLHLKAESEPRIIYGPNPEEKYPRIFYLLSIEAFEGELRDSDIIDGEDLLHPPRWVKAEDLENDRSLLFETHQAIPFAALHYLSRYLSLVE